MPTSPKLLTYFEMKRDVVIASTNESSWVREDVAVEFADLLNERCRVDDPLIATIRSRIAENNVKELIDSQIDRRRRVQFDLSGTGSWRRRRQRCQCRRASRCAANANAERKHLHERHSRWLKRTSRTKRDRARSGGLQRLNKIQNLS